MNHSDLIKIADLIHGGRADNIPDSAFDKGQLSMGARHEMEHTVSKVLAKEIATDHLSEDPKYYTHLKKVEKTAIFEHSNVPEAIAEYLSRSKDPRVVDRFLKGIEKLKARSGEEILKDYDLALKQRVAPKHAAAKASGPPSISPAAPTTSTSAPPAPGQPQQQQAPIEIQGNKLDLSKLTPTPYNGLMAPPPQPVQEAPPQEEKPQKVEVKHTHTHKTASTRALREIRDLIHGGDYQGAKSLVKKLSLRGGLKLTNEGSQVTRLGSGLEGVAHTVVGAKDAPLDIAVRKSYDTMSPMVSKQSLADKMNVSRWMTGKPEFASLYSQRLGHGKGGTPYTLHEYVHGPEPTAKSMITEKFNTPHGRLEDVRHWNVKIDAATGKPKIIDFLPEKLTPSRPSGRTYERSGSSPFDKGEGATKSLAPDQKFIMSGYKGQPKGSAHLESYREGYDATARLEMKKRMHRKEQKNKIINWIGQKIAMIGGYDGYNELAQISKLAGGPLNARGENPRMAEDRTMNESNKPRYNTNPESWAPKGGPNMYPSADVVTKNKWNSGGVGVPRVEPGEKPSKLMPKTALGVDTGSMLEKLTKNLMQSSLGANVVKSEANLPLARKMEYLAQRANRKGLENVIGGRATPRATLYKQLRNAAEAKAFSSGVH